MRRTPTFRPLALVASPVRGYRLAAAACIAATAFAPAAFAQPDVAHDGYAPVAPMEPAAPTFKPPVFQGKPPVFVPPPGSAWQPAAPPPAPLFWRSPLPKPAVDPFGAPKLGLQPRAFPADTRLGSMTPGIFPAVTIDGHAMRFTASATIRNQSNMLAMPASLMNATWPVRYSVDQAGEVKSVWILTDAELAVEAERRR